MVMVPLGLKAGWGGVSSVITRPTEKFGFLGTDLGYFFEGGKGAWVGSIFGDTVDATDPDTAKGRGWRSPVILRTSNKNFTVRGPVWDNAVGGARAKEVWPYRRIGTANPGANTFDCFSIIPNDVIQLPNGYYMGNGFRVRDWNAGGDQMMCHTHGVAWFWSNQKDAEDWQPCRHTSNLGKLYGWANSGWEHFFQNTSMVMMPGDPHLYVFGTPEGRKLGPTAGIYLRRVHWERITDDRAWQFWAFLDGKWQWQNRIAPARILKPEGGAFIGEIDAKVIDGKVVLAYVDGALGAVSRIADRPDATWTNPNILVPLSVVPTMYAPSIHPWSTMKRAYINLSSWTKMDNPLHKVDKNAPASISANYGVYGFSGSLNSLI